MPLSASQKKKKKKKKKYVLSGFALGHTHAMQVLTNVAALPSTAASVIFTNRTTEQCSRIFSCFDAEKNKFLHLPGTENLLQYWLQMRRDGCFYLRFTINRHINYFKMQRKL